jgi:hypothetical protein
MRFHISAAGCATLLAIAACNDNSGPGAAGTMALRIATTPSRAVTLAGASPSLSATPLTYTDDAGNVLVVSAAQVVLKQISFVRADAGDACVDGEHDPDHQANDRRGDHPAADGQHGASGLHRPAFDEADQDEADDSDACEAEALGPVLVDLPLNSGAQQQFEIGIAPGTYTGVRFHIHKANSGSEAPFLTDHPEFVGTSIRVTGTFNDVPFTYTTSLNAIQRQSFTAPVTVDQNGSADVTLLVDLSTWFLDHGTLVDPATAGEGGVNQHLVWDNIKRSFRAFRVDDHTGEADG